MGLRMGAAWGCTWAQHGGAAWGRTGAQGCSVGPRMGAAWGHACARRGSKPGRSAGLRKSAAWGCAGAQGGAAVGRRVGLRTARGAEWEGVAGAGVRLTTGFWRPRCTHSASPGTGTGHRAKGTGALGAGQWVGGRSATGCRHPTPALPGGGGCLTTGSWHPTHVDRPSHGGDVLQGGRGGMPHHSFLASPARRQRLTSRLLAAGQGGGGGGGLTTGCWPGAPVGRRSGRGAGGNSRADSPWWGGDC